MSAKSSKGPKPKAQVPRTLEAIQAEYNQLCTNAGQIQYQIEVAKGQLVLVNNRLLEVNKEASARKELDKAAVPTEAPKAE